MQGIYEVGEDVLVGEKQGYVISRKKVYIVKHKDGLIDRCVEIECLFDSNKKRRLNFKIGQKVLIDYFDYGGFCPAKIIDETNVYSVKFKDGAIEKYLELKKDDVSLEEINISIKKTNTCTIL